MYLHEPMELGQSVVVSEDPCFIADVPSLITLHYSLKFSFYTLINFFFTEKYFLPHQFQHYCIILK